MKKIVFFTQSLGRTGSEIALYNLLSQPLPGIEFHVVTLFNGSLARKLPASVRVYTITDRPFEPLAKRAFAAVKKSFMLRYMRLLKADYWYVNTIMFPEVIAYAAKHSIRLLLHVHELEHMYFSLSAKQVQLTIKHPERIIACSEAAAGVVRTLGRSDGITVVHPAFLSGEKSIVSKEEARQKMNVSPDAFLWMMAGTTDANKDPVLFVSIATAAIRAGFNASFVWLYNGDGNGLLMYCKALAAENGVSRQLQFIDAGLHFADYFNAADGVFITSIKESFSLVALEALSRSRPVVSTACGGINEVIADGTGIIVPSRRPEDFIAPLKLYMEQPSAYNIPAAEERLAQLSFELSWQKWSLIMNSLK